MTTKETEMPPATIALNGIVIHDKGEMLSLTDMWRASGKDPQKTPAKWRDLPQASDFIEYCAITVGKSDSLFAVKEGRGGGTWAHWQVALAYAKYLSPEFHAQCNTVVRAHMEGRLVASPPTAPDIADMVETAIERQLRTTLSTMVAMLVEERLAADPTAAVARGFKPSLQVLIEKKVPPRKRRAFSQKVSHRLRRFFTDRGFEMRISRETSRYLFAVAGINAWLAEEGEGLIRDHIDRVTGQGVLHLVTKKK